MFKNFFLATFSFFSFSISTITGLIDLEHHPQDFIHDIKKINIPGHPHAFNPSIVRMNDCLLMSFREIVAPNTNPIIPSAADSLIGLVWLDNDFNPLGDPYILDFETAHSRIDDPRLLKVGEEIHIVYSDNNEEVVTEGGFRMWTAHLEFDGERFCLKNKHKLSYYEGENPLRREKNWVPFDYQGTLHLAYSLSPHLIFQPLPETECCFTIGCSQSNIHWPWGELRGGTPAIKINERYLSFFHSSIELASVHSEGKSVPHYFIGAYTFSKEPPFEITHISRKPLVAKGFYTGITYPYYWKPVSVVFPCGILAEGNVIWITYGRQDHEIWVAKIDRVRLLKSLLPIDY